MKSKAVFLLFTLAMIIGPTFVFYKVCLKEIQPLTIIFLRTFIGALVVFSIISYKKMVLPQRKMDWLHLLFMAIFSSALPFSLFSMGSLKLESGVCSILTAAVPIFTLGINLIFLKQEFVSSHKIVGIILGCIGVLSLFIPTLTNEIEGDTLAMAGLVVACVSYAVSYNYSKYFLKQVSPVVCSFVQLIFSALLMIPWVLFVEPPFDRAIPSLQTSVVMLIFGIATGFSILLIYKIIELAGPTTLAMVYYIQPVIALMLGKIFLNEDLSVMNLLGCGLIFLGLLYVNESLDLPAFLKKEGDRPQQSDD